MAERQESAGQHPQEIEAGPPPLGDAFTSRLWLARIGLIICVIMTCVVFWMGTHPFWYYGFPIASVWLLVEVTILTGRRREWDDLMRRRADLVAGHPQGHGHAPEH